MEKSPPSNPPRVILSDEEKSSISKSVLLEKWEQQEEYINHLISRTGDDEKLKLQQQEATRRENVLLMRLATKEQEMQEFLSQIQELKEKQAPSTAQLQSMLIDPAVNLLFEKMKTELTETKDRLEQAQNDLSAWKFTPDSTTGKKLMAKCRTLIQENQDLGQQLSQGRIAQLEGELALQKKYSDELKGSQDEMNEFVIQLDEEVEGMQATICALQDELKITKSKCRDLEDGNEMLRNSGGVSTNLNQANDNLQNGALLKQEEHIHKLITPKMEMIDDDDDDRVLMTSNDQCMEDEEEEQFLPVVTNRKDYEEDDERTLLSNGDSNMTDASEELPMETETRITSLSPQHAPPSPNTNSLTADELQMLESDKHQQQQPPLGRPNHVTVIRGTEENNYISPTKGVTKTSFSINDLLAGGPGTEDMKRETTLLPENGLAPVAVVLNGNTDDHVV